MTFPEAMLWQQLRGSKLGFKVRRQHPIGRYVVDFYIREAKLTVEVDLEAHERGDRPTRDAVRDEFLSHNGHRVLRITAVEVLKNSEGVIEGIAAQVTNPLLHPSDGPPPHAGEDQ